MSSEAQINANRENAKRSTGPISIDGKERAAQNNFRHGLFSRRDVVPPEFEEEYQIMAANLTAQLAPATPIEEVLVRQLVSASWRLERCAQIEARLDPETEPELDNLYNQIERVRNSANRLLIRTMAELRRVQTEIETRRARMKPEDADQPPFATLCDTAQLTRNLTALESRDRRRKIGFESQNTQTTEDPRSSAPLTDPDSAPDLASNRQIAA